MEVWFRRSSFSKGCGNQVPALSFHVKWKIGVPPNSTPRKTNECPLENPWLVQMYFLLVLKLSLFRGHVSFQGSGYLSNRPRPWDCWMSSMCYMFFIRFGEERTWFPVGVSSKNLNRKKNKFPPPLYMYIDKNTSWKTNLAKSPAKMDLVGSDDSFP